MKSYEKMIESTTNSLSEVADRLKEASADISSTLDRLEERQDAIRAEEAMKRNIDSFIRAARELERGLLRFDESVNYTFDKIDDELADAVEKLGRMAEILGREELRLRKELLRKRDGVEDVS
jgi:methyl-accepting chemotaxis protein